MKEYKIKYESPIGILELVSDGENIVKIDLLREDFNESDYIPPVLNECKRQLEEYFNGKRKEFKLQLKLVGTEFQKKVWNELLKIPYGYVISYKDIATNVGNKNASRAVGGANNKNNIIIVIPCHRVIGKNGSMVGYGCGINIKEKLLSLEKKYK